MMRIVYCGLILVALATSPSLAKTYQCTITKRSGNNTWVAPEITIYHDEISGTVRIDDAIIREVWDSPMPGKVASDNSKKVRFTWFIRGMKNDKRPTVNTWDIQRGFIYSASFWKSTGKLTVNLFDQTQGGHMGRISGKGACCVTP